MADLVAVWLAWKVWSAPYRALWRVARRVAWVYLCLCLWAALGLAVALTLYRAGWLR